MIEEIIRVFITIAGFLAVFCGIICGARKITVSFVSTRKVKRSDRKHELESINRLSRAQRKRLRNENS
jgi:hypothetical protein